MIKFKSSEQNLMSTHFWCEPWPKKFITETALTPYLKAVRLFGYHVGPGPKQKFYINFRRY